ncbi:WD repeat-containing protein 44-like, partial [Trifolium medium]|nr:WD repeat-containing protein 44-like [Trifolium medium]
NLGSFHFTPWIGYKYRFLSLPMSGSQMSGSFTSNGKHIISVGEDSRVYIWNFNDSGNYFSKQRKTESSCEYFRSKGVTVAIPWSGMTAETGCTLTDFSNYSSIKQRQCVRESERFSFGSWFSIDGSCRGSMTWPEEKLPSWDSPLSEDEFDDEELCLKNLWDDNGVPETWGLSVVAAGLDGTIKTFHNFGFPVRL